MKVNVSVYCMYSCAGSQIPLEKSSFLLAFFTICKHLTHFQQTLTLSGSLCYIISIMINRLPQRIAYQTCCTECTHQNAIMKHHEKQMKWWTHGNKAWLHFIMPSINDFFHRCENISVLFSYFILLSIWPNGRRLISLPLPPLYARKSMNTWPLLHTQYAIYSVKLTLNWALSVLSRFIKFLEQQQRVLHS